MWLAMAGSAARVFRYGDWQALTNAQAVSNAS
jgi:hypothetical protein